MALVEQFLVKIVVFLQFLVKAAHFRQVAEILATF